MTSTYFMKIAYEDNFELIQCFRRLLQIITLVWCLKDPSCKTKYAQQGFQWVIDADSAFLCTATLHSDSLGKKIFIGIFAFILTVSMGDRQESRGEMGDDMAQGLRTKPFVIHAQPGDPPRHLKFNIHFIYKILLTGSVNREFIYMHCAFSYLSCEWFEWMKT